MPVGVDILSDKYVFLGHGALLFYLMNLFLDEYTELTTLLLNISAYFHINMK